MLTDGQKNLNPNRIIVMVVIIIGQIIIVRIAVDVIVHHHQIPFLHHYPPHNNMDINGHGVGQPIDTPGDNYNKKRKLQSLKFLAFHFKFFFVYLFFVI